MKNLLGFVGFVGLLGGLGFVTHNPAYFGFFGFLYYFRYFMVIPDELFKANIQKAATPAFFVGIAIFAITMALTAFSISTLIFVMGLVIGFVVPIFIFTIIFVVCELRESWSK